VDTTEPAHAGVVDVSKLLLQLLLNLDDYDMAEVIGPRAAQRLRSGRPTVADLIALAIRLDAQPSLLDVLDVLDVLQC
jgi:hypothetical protein